MGLGSLIVWGVVAFVAGALLASIAVNTWMILRELASIHAMLEAQQTYRDPCKEVPRYEQ